jgi:hypothetical protein
MPLDCPFLRKRTSMKAARMILAGAAQDVEVTGGLSKNTVLFSLSFAAAL